MPLELVNLTENIFFTVPNHHDKNVFLARWFKRHNSSKFLQTFKSNFRWPYNKNSQILRNNARDK